MERSLRNRTSGLPSDFPNLLLFPQAIDSLRLPRAFALALTIFLAAICFASSADYNPPIDLPTESGIIQSASEDDYPPFCFLNKNEAADGFSVELLRAALKAMGHGVHFKTGPWAEVKRWLEEGRVQALPLVGRTPEREAVFDFTVPYLTMHGAIVVRRGNRDLRALADLKGHQVAVMKGDNAEEFLRREDRGIRIATTPSFEIAFRELASGKHDAVIIQKLVALRLIQEMGVENLVILDAPIEGFKQDFCFAVRDGDRETLALLNEGLSLVIADGTYRQLHSKWFANLELPGNGKIIVGGDDSYPPFEYRNMAGRPSGFNADIMRAIAREMDLEIEFRLGPWDQVIKQLELGEIDAIQGMLYTPERESRFEFTQAHAMIPQVAVGRKQEGQPPASYEALKGKRIVVQQGDIMHDLALKNGLAPWVSAVPTQEQALREVAEGNRDYALVARATALYWIKSRKWDTLILSSKSFAAPPYCIAVPKNHQAVFTQLAEGLEIIAANGEYRRIYEKWLGIYEDKTLKTILRLMFFVGGPLVLVLFGALAWTWALRRMVRRRTEEIRESERFRETILNAITAPVFYKDCEGRYVGCNDAYANLLGIEKARLVGKTAQQIAPADLADVYQKSDEAILQDGQPRAFESEVQDAQGRRIQVIFHKAPIRRSDGSISGIVGALVDITERMNAEKALREAHLWQETAVKAGGVGLWDWNLVDNSVIFSSEWKQQIGYGNEEIKNDFSEWENRVHPEDLDAVKEKIRIAREFGWSRFQAEFRFRHKDGSYRWIFAHASIFRDDEGKAVRIIGTHLDITDRRQTEDALRKNEAMLQQIFDILPVGLWFTDSSGKLIRGNPKGIKIWGGEPLASPEEYGIFKANRIPSGEPVGAKDWSLVRTIRDRATILDELLEIEAFDGSKKIILNSTAPILDAEDRMLGAIVVNQDITNLMRAEERIQHLNEVLQAIRNVNQLIVREQDEEILIREACQLLVDCRSYDSAMIALNQGGGQPYRLARAGIGEVCDAIGGMLQAGTLPHCCAAAAANEEGLLILDPAGFCHDCPIDLDSIRKDAVIAPLTHGGTAMGFLIVTLTQHLGMDDEERSLMVEMADDLAFALNGMRERSARAQAEKEREEMQQFFLQSQKMEIVGQLAGGVAHDFNNILQAISGYAHMAMRSLKPDHPARHDVEEISKGADRASSLTRQLLLFSRRQAMQTQSTDLNRLVENLLKMLRRLIGEHIRLEWKPGNPMSTIQADPGMIEQVVLNLSVNARDAMVDGGTLLIETRDFAMDDAFCSRHPWGKAGMYVLLAVTDTGCGMSEDLLEKIFEPFFTTKGKGKGTGLGLATVYSVVKQHDGIIKVFSEPGRGARFEIYLPVEKQGDKAPDITRKSAPVKLGTETILIAEDEKGVREIARRFLSAAGYTVLCAASGVEALELAEKHEGTIHLLLTDVIMPNMNGKELVECLARVRPDTKVLYMSGYTEDIIASQGVVEESINLLHKPFTSAALTTKIREILSGDPSLAES